MAKAKSSASSATRKKHEKKAQKAIQNGEEPPVAQQPAQRGQKKKKNRFEPKVKSYVPPPPPPKGLPDPVDVYLAGGSSVDAELAVILRRLGKKDEATVGKGVEGLEEWVREGLKEEKQPTAEGDEWKLEQRRDQLVESMQVWAHHFPRLSLHPSRRLRLSCHSLHTLLTTPNPRSALLTACRSALLLPQWTEQREYVGAWAMGPWDGDRSVRSAAKRSWDAVLLGEGAEEGAERLLLKDHAEAVFNFAVEHIISPSTPNHPAGATAAAQADAEASSSADLAALRTQSLLTISHLLSPNTLPSPLPLQQDSLAVLTDPKVWHLADPAASPAALRRALYELLGAIAAREESLLENDEDGVKTVAGQVLRYCWGEDEGWAGVIAFLRRYPQAWVLADEPLSTAHEDRKDGSDDEGSDSEDDSEDEEDDTSPSTPAEPSTATPSSTSSFTPSPTLQLLLTHLTLACSSLPSNYPTILLLLSTLPASHLPPTPEALNLLFESFWAALEGRALNSGNAATNGRSASEEWATSLLECLVWEVNKVEDAEAARGLTREWMARMVATFLATGESKRGRGLATQGVAQQLALTMGKLSAKDEALFAAAWEPLEQAAQTLLRKETTPEQLALSLPALSLALTALVDSDKEAVTATGKDLAVQSLKTAATALQQLDELGGERMELLISFVMSVRVAVASEPAVLEVLDELANSKIATLLASPSPSTSSLALVFLIAYLPTSHSRAAIWTSLFSPQQPSAGVLLRLIKAVQEGQIAVEGLPSAGLEGWTNEVAQRVLGYTEGEWSEEEIQVLERVMLQPEPFVPSTLPSELLEQLATLLPPLATASVASSVPSPALLTSLNAPTRLLANFLLLSSSLPLVRAMPNLALAAFEVGDISPACRLEDERDLPVEAILSAREAWTALSAGAEGERLVEMAVKRCSEAVVSVDVRPSPIELVSICSALLASTSSSLSLSSILPPPSTFTTLQGKLTLLPPSASLSVISPLVPLSTEDAPATYASLIDAAALPPYARSLLALLEVAARSDHAWIRSSSNFWALEHLLLLGDVSRDELASAGSTRGFFGRGVSEEVLSRLTGAADGLASYLVSSVANSLPEGWHVSAVQTLRAKEPVETKDELVVVLDRLARKARKEEEVYARRAFGSLLGSVMRYAEGTQDADRWLAWAQSLSDGAADLGCAVILAVKPLLLETPRYERYQNELASQLAGVPSSAASTKGLPLLRLLLATAPPLDAPIIFLPQQRTMFLIQAMQRWIGSDDDLEEEILASVAELFLHLAPIVQELSGSHWELVFDVVESNLETASWDEPVTLPALYHSCRLLNLVKELAAANSELKATAKARIDKSLELVRDLFVSRPDSRARNQPRVVILEIMAQLIRDLPPKLLSIGDSFNSLLHLLRDPSLTVQQSSFELVVRIAEKHVSDLVVEVELETENPPTIALPQELVDLLSAKLSPDVLQQPDEYSKASTYLLAWLVAFRFFETASPRLKSAYIDQLRRADLIASSFLPSLFAILNLSDRTRVIDIAPWAVNEFHLELVEELTPTLLPVFATFIYYRALQAVPSLIREWWERCKNRQLSMAVSNFTSKHFSPVLIAAELAHLRDPNDPAGKQLRDNDDFTVKVAAGANEVKAVFVVDEESMEIVVKLPAEFPLAQVEVKDVRKVGVKDSQWRAWLLAIQQVIANQNGLIADALNVFKRNVVAHFEGVTPCSICFASIQIVDRSLADRACGICKQRFHRACLWRWFSTSAGATCPLCRSLM